MRIMRGRYNIIDKCGGKDKKKTAQSTVFFEKYFKVLISLLLRVQLRIS